MAPTMQNSHPDNGPHPVRHLRGACMRLLQVLSIAKKNLERTKFEATSIEPAGRINPVFLLLYLLPLFMSQPDVLDWRAWLPVTLVFTVFTATGHNYHFNSLLRLMGWRTYKAGTKEGVTYTLISKRQTRNASEISCVG